jgi:Ca2+-binding EF-hand superfamily protein
MASPNGGTRDLCGAKGLSTIKFVQSVKERLESNAPAAVAVSDIATEAEVQDPYEVDTDKLRELFDSLDTDKSGAIDFKEFSRGIKKLGIAPRKL